PPSHSHPPWSSPSSSSSSSSPPLSLPSSPPPSSPLLAAGNTLPSNPNFLSPSSTFFLQNTNTTITSNKCRSKASPSRVEGQRGIRVEGRRPA
ncbi:hypothetical protein S83_031675, partial [Arachis hypogaea]